MNTNDNLRYGTLHPTTCQTVFCVGSVEVRLIVFHAFVVSPVSVSNPAVGGSWHYIHTPLCIASHGSWGCEIRSNACMASALRTIAKVTQVSNS